MQERKDIHRPGLLTLVNREEYNILVKAACRMKTDAEQQRDWFHCKLYDTYSLLGQVMTGDLEPAAVGLTRLLNMANILCQSTQYHCVETLKEGLPSQWKICIRCLQEMMQGKPDSILPLFRNMEFQSHIYCANYLYRMAKLFSEGKGTENLRRENARYGRDRDWGIISPTVLPSDEILNETHSFLLAPSARNCVQLPPFYDEISSYLQELEE